MRPMPLTVHQLGSGSGGNLTALEGPEGVVLLDAGFPAREVLRRLEAAGLARQRLRALVLSHAHQDHARGAPLLARRLGLPIFGSEWTLKNLGGRRGGEELHPLPLQGKATVAGLCLETMAASHDLPGTLLFRVEDRLGVATDLGVAPPEVIAFLSGLEGLLLEFNHDRELLRLGPYPEWLKARVAGETGHLANDQAAALLATPGFRLPLRRLWLCHLSRHNNRPELALAAAREALDGRGPEILVTDQERAVPPVSFP